ncbi:hypothetical protein P7I20_14725 [Enterococcus casseliflavus]|uniref:hypothetical protein n=1 Tax=Enterococcus casseliflavus TaxID=37734 RepID=UPI002891F069|nr:hypothetical protein [Enterococcus casseliflavus]MDT2980633.1 hypothetical protein [Enterococcus casseliflavus]
MNNEGNNRFNKCKYWFSVFGIGIIIYVIIYSLLWLDKSGKLGLIVTFMTLFVGKETFNILVYREPTKKEESKLSLIKVLWTFLFLGTSISNLIIGDYQKIDSILFSLTFPIMISMILLLVTMGLLNLLREAKFVILVKNSEKKGTFSFIDGENEINGKYNRNTDEPNGITVQLLGDQNKVIAEKKGELVDDEVIVCIGNRKILLKFS